MYNPKFTKDYIWNVLADPMRFGADYQEMLKKSEEQRRIYHGDVIPMTYQGFFFTPETIREFETIIQTMVSIGRKVTAAFVADPSYRRGFHFDAATEELILLDPGYEIPVPVGRYDIFYNGPDAYQFCELNTDGSSAMNEDRVLGGILEHTQIFDTMAEEWRWRRFELFDSLVNAFLARYESIRGSRAKVVAIVDLLDKGTTVEFEVFRQAFARAGVRALICDVRRLTFDGTHLIGVDPETGEKLPIDLVYRRLVTSDFVAMRKEAEAFEAAYRAQAFVSFGSFRSQVMHAKTIFSMLHAPETKRILSAAENAFIAAHVPWTKELIDAEDQARIIDEKDRYILKPYNSYSSQGVLLGREHSAKEWADIVRGLPFDRYIYQEYVDVDRTPFVVPDGKGGMAIEHLGHVIGLFLYDEKFAGIYTRVGREGIISGARTYYTAPAFVVERRRAHE